MTNCRDRSCGYHISGALNAWQYLVRRAYTGRPLATAVKKAHKYLRHMKAHRAATSQEAHSVATFVRLHLP